MMNIPNKKFKKLCKCHLPKELYHCESELYHLYDDNLIFKKYDVEFLDRTNYCDNKIYTINKLIDLNNDMEIDHLVFPEEIVNIDNKFAGYSMPYIPNTNLKTLLNNKLYTLKDKIYYLKEIGRLLEYLKELREKYNIDFYLNDIHEDNFIISNKDKKLYAIDLDSSKIGYNLPSTSRYLTQISEACNCNKYVQNPNILGGQFEIDYNTEIYAYIMTILHFFSKEEFDTVSIDDYYDYLSYLQGLHVSNELLDIFAKIYEYGENINPYELLDQLEPYYEKLNYHYFFTYQGLRRDKDEIRTRI